MERSGTSPAALFSFFKSRCREQTDSPSCAGQDFGAFGEIPGFHRNRFGRDRDPARRVDAGRAAGLSRARVQAYRSGPIGVRCRNRRRTPATRVPARRRSHHGRPGVRPVAGRQSSSRSALSATPGSSTIFSGRCYAAADPLLGTDNGGGNVWTLVGNELVRQKLFDTVVLVTIAVSGSYIGQWAPGGRLHAHLMEAVNSIGPGLAFTHVFVQQGESDLMARHAGGGIFRAVCQGDRGAAAERNRRADIRRNRVRLLRRRGDTSKAGQSDRAAQKRADRRRMKGCTSGPTWMRSSIPLPTAMTAATCREPARESSAGYGRKRSPSRCRASHIKNNVRIERSCPVPRIAGTGATTARRACNRCSSR